MYRTRRRNGQLPVNTVKNLMALAVILGFAAVLFFVSSIGKFIAQNVFVPLLGPKSTVSATPAPNATETATRSITVPGLQYYALSLGQFDNKEAAVSASLDAVRRGAGGFLWQYESKTLVLASAYKTQADAQSVQENLAAQQVSATIKPIAGPAAEFNVTAANTTLDLIEKAYADYIALCDDLTAKSVGLDKAELTTAACQRAGEQWKTKLSATRASLVAAGAESNALLSGLLDLYDGAIHELDKLIKLTDVTALDFSAKIKYTYLECLTAYASYLEGIQ